MICVVGFRFAQPNLHNYLDGKKIKKELHLKLNEALNLADEDIKENWKVYQKAFLEGK
ncbi:DUF7718 family protein [Candidatus Brocadia sinica]|uniref:DUF7718 family protein n=1 Tax=Candidatus Brocadia TaxID=380240 RepID=UPI003B967906